MTITTSFGQIKIISPNIAELIIKQGVEISLELVEKYDAFMSEQFNEEYAVLINRINSYSYTYEALLCIGSAKNLKAAAIINYNTASKQQTKELKSMRHMDNLNIKEFSGLELGRDNATNWLKEQLTHKVS